MARTWSLLVLPPPPEPQTLEALDAAYRPALVSIITKLRTPDRQAGLIVAVSSPPSGYHALSWKRLQSILSGIYSIIVVACARERIPCEGVGGVGGTGAVNSTVVLLDLEEEKEERSLAQSQSSRGQGRMAVLGLRELATPGRPWDYIYHVDWHARPLITAALASLGSAGDPTQTVIIGGGSAPDSSLESPTSAQPCSLYGVVCLGGTFDHLHAGHNLLLSAAALLLDTTRPGLCELIVGITGDELLKNKKFPDHLQSWHDRAGSVLTFLSTFLDLAPDAGTGGGATSGVVTVVESPWETRATFRNGAVTVRCVEIRDLFGPTITRENVDALVVSRETQAGGQAVNDKRRGLGWKELEIYTVDVIDAESLLGPEQQVDFATKVSSTTIRQTRAEAAKRQQQLQISDQAL